MADYYDVVLGLIPLSVAVISAALVGLGAALPLAVSAGALSAVVLIGHAMFVRAPVGKTAARGRSNQTSDSSYSEQSPVNAAD